MIISSENLNKDDLNVHEQTVAKCENCSKYGYSKDMLLCVNMDKILTSPVADGNAIRLDISSNLVWLHGECIIRPQPLPEN